MDHTVILIQTQTEGDASKVVMWSAVLLVILIVGLALVLRLKKRLAGGSDEIGPIGFTLSDLRQLHKSGQMTDEEFERAKAKMIEGSKRALERAAAPRLTPAERKQAAEAEAMRLQLGLPPEDLGARTRPLDQTRKPRPPKSGDRL